MLTAVDNHRHSKLVIVFGPFEMMTWGSQDPVQNTVLGCLVPKEQPWGAMEHMNLSKSDTCAGCDII